MGLWERVDKLEKGENENSAPQGPDPDFAAILDELASLRVSGAVHYRAGVRIQGEDIPRQILGEGYTRLQLRELAISRAFGKQGRSATEIAELLPLWLERFEDIDRLIRQEA
jgi:hypothetical protein